RRMVKGAVARSSCAACATGKTVQAGQRRRMVEGALSSRRCAPLPPHFVWSPLPASRGGKRMRRERPEMLSIETKEPAELVRCGTRRAKTVGGVAVVAITDRHRAKQHLFRRHFHERTDNAMHARPRFLGAGVETVTARQIHQRVDVAAEIGPLAGAEPPIESDEQRDRRIEDHIIAFVLAKPRRGIIAIDLERTIELHAMMVAARFVRLPHRFRIDRIFRVFMARIAAGDRGRDLRFKLGERRTGGRVDLPRVQIAARGRARGARDQVADERWIDRPIEKPAAGDTGIDGFKHIHGTAVLKTVPRSLARSYEKCWGEAKWLLVPR